MLFHILLPFSVKMSLGKNGKTNFFGAQEPLRSKCAKSTIHWAFSNWSWKTCFRGAFEVFPLSNLKVTIDMQYNVATVLRRKLFFQHAINMNNKSTSVFLVRWVIGFDVGCVRSFVYNSVQYQRQFRSTESNHQLLMLRYNFHLYAGLPYRPYF